VLGPAGTLIGRCFLARFTGEAGDVERARDLFTELVDDVTEVYGPDHRTTLRARSYLAKFTGQAGDVESARDLYAELVEHLRRVLGPDHQDTLAARSTLARLSDKPTQNDPRPTPA
jgi:hypothetical protein